MARVTKEALLKRGLPTRDVELPGIGTVTVRALSRAQVLVINDLLSGIPEGVPGRVATLERALLRYGIAEPELSEDDVCELYDVSPGGEINVLTEAIQELSAMTEGAAREAYKSFRDGPG